MIGDAAPLPLARSNLEGVSDKALAPCATGSVLVGEKR
jgi:hypothetical protein